MLPSLAVALALPSLWGGWVADDHHHRLRLADPSDLPEALADVPGSPMELFTFAEGDPAHMRRMMDLGLWPWWTLPELRAAFMRPVTALTHWVDYRLWPESPAFMHAQSLLWFAGLITVTTLFYRRLYGLTWVAGLAALLYTIDDARALPAGWLANRNALITTFLGISALIAHDRWRRNGWQVGAVVGPLLLTASLLAKEAGIATCAYLFAYALFLDRGTRRERFLALLPYAAVVLVWRIVWTHLGYGVWGIEIYVDPVVEPLRYTAAVLRRAPALLLGQLFIPPSELYLLCVDLGIKLYYSALLAVVVVLVAVVMIPRLVWDRMTRFWAVGMMLSLLPICATFPADRGLSFVSLGAFALLAQFLGVFFGWARDHVGRALPDATGMVTHGVGDSLTYIPRTGKARPTSTSLDRQPADPPRRPIAKALGIALVAVHMVLAPLLLMVRSAMPIGPVSFIESLQVNLPMDATVEQQTLVIVTAPLPLLSGYVSERRALDGLPIPAHTRVLSPSESGSVTVSRPDAYTLIVRPAHGYLAYTLDQLARGSDHPMSLGQKVELTGMTAEVTALTDDGRPAEAAFRFSVPLEHPSLRWVAWGNPSYVPFTAPAVGETITLPISHPEAVDSSNHPAS